MQVANCFRYTKDIHWLISQFESVSRGLKYLMEKDFDKNYIPEGSGIMEIGGFYLPNIEMIDVAIYTYKAFLESIYIFNEILYYNSNANNKNFQNQSISFSDRIDCLKHNENDCIQSHCLWSSISQEDYKEFNLPYDTPWCFFPSWNLENIDIHRIKKEKEFSSFVVEKISNFINQFSWIDNQNNFAEFFATTNDAIPIIQEAIQRVIKLPNRKKIHKKLEKLLLDSQNLSESEKMIKKPWNIYQSWITSIPLEEGFFSDDFAILSLHTAKKYSNEFGMYVTGIDKPDDEKIEFDSNHYHGLYTNAVMTLPTGVQAVAEGKYSNVSGILFYLSKLSDSFSYETPGTLHELSPSGGCFIQAWNIYSIAVPIVNHIFGLHVDSKNNQTIVNISPLFPDNWPSMEISNYYINSNSFISYKCEMESKNINISCFVELFSFDTEKILIHFNWILKQKMLSGKKFIAKVNGKGITLNNKSNTSQIPLDGLVNSWKLELHEIPNKVEL